MKTTKVIFSSFLFLLGTQDLYASDRNEISISKLEPISMLIGDWNCKQIVPEGIKSQFDFTQTVKKIDDKHWSYTAINVFSPINGKKLESSGTIKYHSITDTITKVVFDNFSSWQIGQTSGLELDKLTFLGGTFSQNYFKTKEVFHFLDDDHYVLSSSNTFEDGNQLDFSWDCIR